MNIFENILINIIFIICPLTLWLLYQVCAKVLDKKKGKIFLDIALFGSFYLIIKFGVTGILNSPIFFFNVPLILAYIKKQNFSIITLSLIIVIYYSFHLNFNIILLIIEYITYLIVYLIIQNKKLKDNVFINLFIIIKLIAMAINLILNSDTVKSLNYEIYILVILFIGFYIVTNFIIYLFNEAEKILSIHLKFSELEHQKEITDSLFQITHEIKNPIAVCKGYLDMFDVNNPEHSKKYIPILKDEINRLLILLEDFLSINKIKINKEVIDINLLLEDMLHSFSPIFKGKNIKQNFSIDEDEFYIMADYNRLSQVLMNLIKNSMESIPKEQNGIISLYKKKSGNSIKIYVEDNGEGISKKNMEKIKSPFFTTKSRGTGLGVYLCNEIIEAHNGNIKYFSKKGKGTKVIITLPYNKKDIKMFS